MNKHQAMFDFIMQYNAFPLTFNFTGESTGDTSLNTVYSDTEIKRYFGGSQKEYIFAIKQMKEYSTGVMIPPVNAEVLESVQGFMDWIDQQDRLKNYPDFGANCKIQKIENLQNMPNVAGTDEATAQYMFQCRVLYYEKKER